MIDKKDCLIWIGPKNNAGYGVIIIRGRQVRAHRFIYENTKGPVPKTLVIDHLCMNRACVNINHLEPVTIQENFRRAKEIYDLLEKCDNGHPLTEESSRPGRNNSVTCRKCANNRMKKWRERNPQQVEAANSNRWSKMTEDQKQEKYQKQNLIRKNAPKNIKVGVLKTHCIHGHSLEDAFVKKNKKNSRDCRECSRIRAEKYRKKQHVTYSS